MTMLTLKYRRLMPEESIALLKDKENPKKRIWRHRFVSVHRAVSKQHYKDYPYRRFKTIDQFESYIEKQKLKSKKK